MTEQKNVIENQTVELPVVALRGKVFLPNTFLNFEVGRPISVTAVETAVSMQSEIFIAPQKSVFIDSPRKSDISTVGVVAKIKQIIKPSQNLFKVNVEGLYRAKIVKFCDTKNYFSAIVERADYIPIEDKIEEEAYFRIVNSAFKDYALNLKKISKEMYSVVSELNSINAFMDNAISVVNLKDVRA